MIKADVIVCGAGPAGIAAAIQASRAGAKTLLIEKDSAVGGMSTLGLINTFCGVSKCYLFNKIKREIISEAPWGKLYYDPEELILKETLQYIKNNYHKNLTLKGVADRAGYTPNYFGVLIKAETGMSFRTYLNHIRIEQAHRYLLTTSLPVQEIMHWVGLSDYAGFLRQYNAVYGCTPALTRKNRK